jgi:hypothetical protein
MDDRTKAIIEKTAYDIDDMAYETSAARAEAADIVRLMRDPTISFPEAPAPDQWDTELRGPRMSGTTGNRIWKYQMPVLEEFEMDLPAGAEIVRVAAENGMLWLWAQVSTTAPSETRRMRAFKAGGTMPDDMTGLSYVGCAPIYIQQELMLYFYEEVSA